MVGESAARLIEGADTFQCNHPIGCEPQNFRDTVGSNFGPGSKELLRRRMIGQGGKYHPQRDIRSLYEVGVGLGIPFQILEARHKIALSSRTGRISGHFRVVE